MPVAVLERPWSKKVDPQVNKKRETVTFCVGFNPFVDWSEITSCATSPVVATCVTVLSGKRLQVLLLQPGLGGEKQSP